MGVFLRRLGIFAFVVLVVLVAAEVYVERLPNPARDKHQWLLANSRRVETLILGNSHAFYNINPGLIPGVAFNLALPSQTLRYDDFLLRHYEFDSLQWVILPFSYCTLHEDFEGMENVGFEAVRYRLYMDCDIHPRWGQYGLECLWRGPFVEKLKSLYRSPMLSWDERGWGTNFRYDLREEDWDSGAESAAKNNTYEEGRFVSLNRGFLDDIITFCDEHDVRLLLVTTPVSDRFLANLSVWQNGVNRRVLEELLAGHPGVRYVDYTYDKDFTDRDFFDAHHLNEYGAEKLTRKLVSEMGL